ncbi:MAG: hypothetical protein ACNA7G_10865 [Methylobacter sp.]
MNAVTEQTKKNIEATKSLCAATAALQALDTGLFNDDLQSQINGTIDGLQLLEQTLRAATHAARTQYKNRNQILIKAVHLRLHDVNNQREANQFQSGRTLSNYEAKRQKLVDDGYAAADVEKILPTADAELERFAVELDTLTREKTALETYLGDAPVFDESVLEPYDLSGYVDIVQAKHDYQKSLKK